MNNEIKYAQIEANPTVESQSWAVTRGYRDTPHRAVGCVIEGQRVVVSNWYESNGVSFTEFVEMLKMLQPELDYVGVMTRDPNTCGVLRGCGIGYTQANLTDPDVELVVPIEVKGVGRWLGLVECAAQIALMEDVCHL